MRQSSAILLLGGLTAAACGPSIQSARFTSAPARPDTTEVHLFSTKVPECPFEELGIVRGKPRYFWNSPDDVLESMKSRARTMGGDAIVSVTSAEVVNGAIMTSYGVDIETAAGLSGTVIRFSNPECLY